MILREQVVLGRTRSQTLRSVTRLNLWGNDLSDISIFRFMNNVKVVSLSMNKIKSLKDFQTCTKMEELYLRKNEIDDLKDIRYLKNSKELKILWLSDNPCANEEDYRLKVLSCLPFLKKLDSKDVSEEEVSAAMKKYRSFGEMVLNLPFEDDDDEEEHNPPPATQEVVNDNNNIYKQEKERETKVNLDNRSNYRSEQQQQQQQYRPAQSQSQQQNQAQQRYNNRKQQPYQYQQRQPQYHSQQPTQNYRQQDNERGRRRRRGGGEYSRRRDDCNISNQRGGYSQQQQQQQQQRPQYDPRTDEEIPSLDFPILDLPEPPPFEEMEGTMKFPHENPPMVSSTSKTKKEREINEIISRNNIYNAMILLVRELDVVHLEKLEKEIKNLKMIKKGN